MRQLTIKAKLYLMTIVGVLGVLVVLGLACLTLFRVQGPVYADIVRDKDILTDIQPPPLYVVEAFLVLHESEELSDASAIREHEGWFIDLEDDYHERYAHWTNQLAPDDFLRLALAQRTNPLMDEFFRSARAEYFPALLRGDHATAASLLGGSLHELFKEHRKGVKEVVALEKQRVNENEAVARARIEFWMRLLLAVSVLTVLGLGFGSWSLTRSVLHSTDILIHRVEDMASHEADLNARVGIDSKDEMGRLAAGINRIISKMFLIVERTRAAEQESSHLRQLLRNIIDSMPSVLVGVDPEYRVMQWNREAERVTGLEVHEALGKNLLEVLPELQPHKAMIDKSLRHRIIVKDKRITWKKPDREQLSDLTIYPLFANGVSGAVMRIDDVTTRVKLEEIAIQSEKMVSLGGLAAGLAHEINNPLAGMVQNAQLILNRMDDNLGANREAAARCGVSLDSLRGYMDERGITEMIQDIRTCGERAAEIISNMLAFCGNTTSGSVHLESLDELLDRAVELAVTERDRAKRYNFKDIEIVREYAPDLPRVSCRQTEILQVALNLLRNAADALHEAEPRQERPRITLRTARADDSVQFEVKDNGPGIPDAIRRRIFEPFFTTKEPQSGTGLGLFVSYFIIVRNHNGFIAVNSSIGRGTTFIVSMPMAAETKHAS